MSSCKFTPHPYCSALHVICYYCNLRVMTCWFTESDFRKIFCRCFVTVGLQIKPVVSIYIAKIFTMQSQTTTLHGSGGETRVLTAWAIAVELIMLCKFSFGGINSYCIVMPDHYYKVKYTIVSLGMHLTDPSGYAYIISILHAVSNIQLNIVSMHDNYYYL